MSRASTHFLLRSSYTPGLYVRLVIILHWQLGDDAGRTWPGSLQDKRLPVHKHRVHLPAAGVGQATLPEEHTPGLTRIHQVQGSDDKCTIETRGAPAGLVVLLKCGLFWK